MTASGSGSIRYESSGLRVSRTQAVAARDKILALACSGGMRAFVRSSSQRYIRMTSPQRVGRIPAGFQRPSDGNTKSHESSIR